MAIVISLCAALLFAAFVYSTGLKNPIAITIAAGVIGAVSLTIYRRKRDKRIAAVAVRDLTKAHLTALARKRSQLMLKDDYGRTLRDSWDREISMFLDEIVMPTLKPGAQLALERHMRAAFSYIDAASEREQSNRVSAIEYRDDLTPKEFEVFCAETLGRQGWSARAIGQIGDQGADVLAEKGARRVVIQCKKYSGAVGNSAIQEAHAAKAHYSAQIAVVVTNSTFTPSARTLAKTTGVLLLHPTDLAAFDSQLAAAGG